MNEWLAQMYNTNGAAEVASEETEKLAQVDLFCKLAAQNNINLANMSQDEIGALYAQVFPKYAQEGEEDEEEKKKEEEEKKRLAEAYVEEKKASQEKLAEADFMGRIMAHSFVQELEQIKEAGVAERAAGAAKYIKDKAGYIKDKAKEAPGYIKGKAKEPFEQMSRGYKDVVKGREMHSLGRKGMQGKLTQDHSSAAELAMAGQEKIRGGLKEIGKGGLKAAVPVVGAGALGGTAIAANKYRKSSRPAEAEKDAAAQFEELAANHAVKLAEDSGYDVDQAVERVGAVYTLGLQETEKVASVSTLDDALDLRGLEYLEAAGYSVDWEAL